MQYILAYLAAQVTVNNAGRPGIFTNATLEEYDNREIAKKGRGIYHYIRSTKCMKNIN